MNKIFERKIFENGFGRFQFHVNKEIKSLNFVLDGSISFISMMIYDDENKLVGQIVTNKLGKRNLSSKLECSSPGFKSLENHGVFTVEYINSTKPGQTLYFEVNKESDSNNLSDETNLVHDRSIDGKTFSWFKGDFHTHTIFSDGKMTREANNKQALKQGLDFFAPTDHNFTHFSWPKGSPLIIPGTEITSNFGHVNLLFETESVFEKFSLNDLIKEEDYLKILDSLEDKIFTINHPFMSDWKFMVSDFKLEHIKFMEIINDPTYPDSKEATRKAIRAWNVLLNNGYKVFGIGGSDSHLLPSEKYEDANLPSLIGDPISYIYAEELSISSLKKNMLEGNISVSRLGLIELSQVDNTFEVSFTKEKTFDEGLHFDWIFDGKVIKEDTGLNSRLKLELDDNYHWLRVDLKDKYDNLYGFTNPKFFNLEKSQRNIHKWKDLCEEIFND